MRVLHHHSSWQQVVEGALKNMDRLVLAAVQAKGDPPHPANMHHIDDRSHGLQPNIAFELRKQWQSCCAMQRQSRDTGTGATFIAPQLDCTDNWILTLKAVAKSLTARTRCKQSLHHRVITC